MKWFNWYEVCELCGSPSQVLMTPRDFALKGGEAKIGDLARCTHCYCLGKVHKDYWGFYIQWPQDACSLCYREMDDKLDKLTKRIHKATQPPCDNVDAALDRLWQDLISESKYDEHKSQ